MDFLAYLSHQYLEECFAYLESIICPWLEWNWLLQMPLNKPSSQLRKLLKQVFDFKYVFNSNEFKII